jgi:hypothetical protein
MPLLRRFAAGGFALAATGFVALAVHRRLNFDEALALRAGWLDLARIDAEPAFVMPWTLLLGALGHLVDDPGAVFLIARLFTVTGILAATWYALRRSGLAGARRSLAGILLLAHGTFVTHGLEFRYDAAILAALLVLFGAVAPAGRERPALAGVTIAVLALHHLKGAVFAVALTAWCVARWRRRPADSKRFALGAGATLALWGVSLGLSGHTEGWLATLGGFWALSRQVTRVAAFESLGPAMMRDLAWWLVAAGALVAAMRNRHRAEREDSTAPAIAFAAVTLGFVVVHPHPWDYMLALPAPFLAMVVAASWPPGGLRDRAGRIWIASAVSALALQLAVGHGSPATAWRSAIDAPRAPVDAMLRALRSVAASDDKVLDPTGLVYFLPPCTREWYLDTLFAEAVVRGAWMQELAGGVPDDCRWALASPRLAVLPKAAQGDLAREFVRFPAAIATRTSRLSPREYEVLGALPPLRIKNHW